MLFPHSVSKASTLSLLAFTALVTATSTASAALLAYEPFTNAAGANIIGSGSGIGFSGVWQSNSSGGVATNTASGLNYTDSSGKTLLAIGGAGFFQGLTSANTSMQPIRPFSFARGTNGTDATTTWISFLAVRQGPAVAGSNPYPRGANVPHDINSGAIQKLAIGNSSGAVTNTIGLIPQGSGANLKSSAASYSATNFIVVRIDHAAGAANDNAYLFINPSLSSEPSLSQADTNSLGSFDFSFDRLRVFAGGQASAGQPYAELIVDEYRLGETFADVAPYAVPLSSALIITNTVLDGGNIVLSGTGGSNNAGLLLLASADLTVASTIWPAVASNSFDANGNFVVTSSIPSEVSAQFYRVRVAPPPPLIAPTITTHPTNLSLVAGQNAVFAAAATGSAPLGYQWYFNTNSAMSNGTGETLLLNNVQATNAGSYHLLVSNSAGSATSSVVTLTVWLPPGITAQPLSQAVTVSNDATFSITATGTAPLRYQWFFNTNTPLASATNASLTVTNARFTNAGFYSAIVTNNHGAITSAFAQLTVSDTVVTNGAYFVATTGSDSNPGTIIQPFLTISKGLAAVPNGGQVYVRGGTYALPSKLSLSRTTATNTIRLWAYPGETVVIDSSGNSSDGIGISGRWYHVKGLTVVNAGHNGINISGHSNIVEFCTVRSNGNTGLHITGGSSGTTFPSYNLILNCDAYLNYDPPIGGNADGFSAKWNLGPGNVFSGCRAWWNSDDGWDLWMGNAAVVITNCWAFYNGTNYWNDPEFNGNGQGFKLGGNHIGAPHRLVRSVAFLNEASGVDQNNNITGQIIDNNTSWANRSRNYNLAHGTNTTPHVVRNNLSFAGGSSDSFTAGTLSTNNSWQLISSPAANTGDVQSVSTSPVTGPRNTDGSLPEWPFLRPVAGGRLIDKGMNTGDAYNGTAPDLGAFELP